MLRLKNIYNNYYWILTISAVLGIVTNHLWLNTIIFPFIIFYKISSTRLKKSLYVNDILFVALGFIILLSWLLNSFTNKSSIILMFVLSNGAFMSTYFIGRNMKRMDAYYIFECSLLPIAVVNILGVILFFWQPEWYVQITLSNPFFEGLEAERMRSVFSSPYVCSYASFFAISYILLARKDIERKGRFFYSTAVVRICLVSCILALVLCMQRAPIGGAILAIGIYFVVSSLKTRNIFKLIVYFFIIVLLGALIYYVLSKYMASDSIDYFFEKFEILFDSEDNFFKERKDLFVIDDSLLGDGAGRHSHYAMMQGEVGITDNEYGKLMQEVGIIGQFLQIAIIVLAMLKSLLNWRLLSFELCVLLFLLVAMNGADPLSLYELHPLFFWIVIGSVVSFRKKKKKNGQFSISGYRVHEQSSKLNIVS